DSAAAASAGTDKAATSTALALVAPKNLGASVVSASKINLTWRDNSAGQDSFQIKRSTDGSTFSQVAAVGAGVTSYADSGLASATYYYQVVGVTAQGGNGGATAVVGAAPAPAAPGNLSATAVSGTQINLKWTDNSTNETGYHIERSTDGTTFTQIA